jgi:hypothetical protein
MKKLLVLLAALILVALVVPVMAQESVLPPNANKALIEQNLLIGLNSENQGLQRSSALMLGTIQSDRAVIPLMAALKSSQDENLRAAAAWSLCKIGDERGVYAVKMATKFDESNKVQVRCAWYYETLVEPGTFTFTQSQDEIVASVE